MKEDELYSSELYVINGTKRKQGFNSMFLIILPRRKCWSLPYSYNQICICSAPLFALLMPKFCYLTSV